MLATRADKRSLSPYLISVVATVSFSLTTGTAPSIEVAPALFRVTERQQHLRRRNASRLEYVLIGAGEADLSDSRRRLTLLELERSLRQSESMAAECNGPGRNKNDILAIGHEARNIIGQRIEPRCLQLSCGAVDQKSRADLHHDTARVPPFGANADVALRLGSRDGTHELVHLLQVRAM